MPTKEELEELLEEAMADEADAVSRVSLYQQQLEERDYDDV